MNGYLQCLIDQYESKVSKALGGVERTIYSEVLNDLVKLQKYGQEPQDPSIEQTHRKHMAIKFVGTIPGLMEYLKNLDLKER